MLLPRATRAAPPSLPRIIHIKSLAVKLRLKCDGTRAEARFRLSAKRTNPFKSAVASVQSTTDSRGVRISGSNAGYTMFRGSVKSTGYPRHSPISPSLPLPCVTVCHYFSTGLYPFLHYVSVRPFLPHLTSSVLRASFLAKVHTTYTLTSVTGSFL